MKMFRTLMLVAAVVLACTNASFAQKNRPMLEEYTGAWCGWCPDGEVRASDLVKAKPDVIWVAIHNGDKMTLTEEATLTSSYISGFPMGTVDRKAYNNAIGLDRGQWAAAAGARMNAEVEADVKLENMTFNQATKEVSVTLSAKFLKSLSGEFRVNLYVVEDEVTDGSGTGYDQSNYLSGRAGYESSPYYSQPAKIPNFKHRNVVREMKGGAWGEAGVIPNNPASGSTYSKTYTFTLNSKYKPGFVSLVGFVQAYNSDTKMRQIVNADKVELLAGNRVSAEITCIDNYGEVPANTKNFMQKVSVTNPTSNTLNANLSIDLAGSTIPSGWDVSINPGSVSIPKNGNVEVNLVFNTDGAAAFSKVHILCDPVVSGTQTAVQTSADYFGLSDNTKQVILTGLDDNASVTPTYYATVVGKSKFATTTALVPASSQIFQTYDFSKFDLIIVPMDYTHSRDNFYNNDDLVNALASAMDAGKRVILTGELATYNAFRSGTANVKSFMSDYFGISGTAGNPLQRFTQSGTTITFSQFGVKGITGDEISNGMTFSGNATGAIEPTYFNDILMLSSSGVGTKFLTYEQTAQIGGVRSQTANSRGIFLTFNPSSIPSASARTTFVGKLIDWVTGALTVEKAPDIKLTGEGTANTVEFGTIKAGETSTKTFTITNTGTADLVITSWGMAPEYKDVMTLSGGGTFPITIAAGQKQTFSLQFKPKVEEDVITYCTFKSNGKSAIDTDGESILGINATVSGQSSSVEPYASNDGVLSVNAVPNPFSDQTKIVYTVNGSTAQNVTVRVVDALGNTVTTLVNSVTAPGVHTVAMNASTLATGTYRVVVNAGTSSAFMPVVLVK